MTKAKSPDVAELTEVIRKAALAYMEDIASDPEAYVGSILSGTVNSVVLNAAGIERDGWSSGNYKLKRGGDETPLASLVKVAAGKTAASLAREIIDGLGASLTAKELRSLRQSAHREYMDNLDHELRQRAANRAVLDANAMLESILNIDVDPSLMRSVATDGDDEAHDMIYKAKL